MKEIYLDNAATSRHKPDKVQKAMNNYFNQIGCSPGRGGYECSLQASRLILKARRNIAKLFNVPTPEQIIFTHNITHSLNYTIKGLLNEGDHVITTSMEHNAVLRPLNSLQEKGIIKVTYISCNQDGTLNPDNIKQAIKDNTKLLVFTHASNVTGTLMPIQKLANIAQEHNLISILDTAQTAGSYKLDFSQLKVDVLAFTGHKGLMGPTGTGGFAISNQAAEMINPLIEGGTGSVSDKEYQPDFLPDKFESGTLNTVGITGLNAGIKFIMETGIEKIKKHKLKLMQKLLNGLQEITKIKVHGPQNINWQTSTISINVENCDLGELSFTLDDKYGIMTRSGLHCAPFAHKTIGTFPEGTLRFSLGYFNTEKEIEFTLKKLKQIIK